MVVGLTGGICTGKSTAAAALIECGVRVLDCDDLARFLTDYDPAIRAAIRAGFGAAAFFAGGAVNRSALGAIVFSDDAQRRRLEQILHPPIVDWVVRNTQAAHSLGEELVVVVPLLFECRMQDLFDETWLVTCSPELQLRRLMARGNMTADEAARRIAAQWPLSDKVSLATRIFVNDGTIPSLQEAIRSSWTVTIQA